MALAEHCPLPLSCLLTLRRAWAWLLVLPPELAQLERNSQGSLCMTSTPSGDHPELDTMRESKVQLCNLLWTSHSTIEEQALLLDEKSGIGYVAIFSPHA